MRQLSSRKAWLNCCPDPMVPDRVLDGGARHRLARPPVLVLPESVAASRLKRSYVRCYQLERHCSQMRRDMAPIVRYDDCSPQSHSLSRNRIVPQADSREVRQLSRADTAWIEQCHGRRLDLGNRKPRVLDVRVCDQVPCSTFGVLSRGTWIVTGIEVWRTRLGEATTQLIGPPGRSARDEASQIRGETIAWESCRVPDLALVGRLAAGLPRSRRRGTNHALETAFPVLIHQKPGEVLYRKPAVERFGSFRELTQLGFSSASDGASIFATISGSNCSVVGGSMVCPLPTGPSAS